MNGYWIVVRKPMELMTELVEIFCGGANLSLEGNLSHCDSSMIENSSIQETALLKRNTLYPKQDFVILPLEIDTKDIVIKRIFPQVGLRNNVYHVLIEKEGELVFSSYDCFDPDCVWITYRIDESFLESLKESDVIKKYTKVAGGRNDA